MIIFPAIDLFEGKAVRLLRGDYDRMTVYGDPENIAKEFSRLGAEWIHIVDLEGARSGGTPNLDTVLKIKRESGLKCEIGGGVRNIETVRRHLDAGMDRVILGTAAVTDEPFLIEAVEKYGEKIAVGADIKEGLIALKGWTEKSDFDVYTFFEKMEKIGVKTVICTDVSKDGAMKGTNHPLYKELSKRYKVNIVASGGVSSVSDVKKLSALGIYGAIVGKAYYTGAIDIKEAIEAAK